MIYEMKYLCSNWEIKTSPFHPNMEILGSFIACINELAPIVKRQQRKDNELRFILLQKKKFRLDRKPNC